MSKWLLMTYKVPREPSANRVYVWRKLKQLGAIAVHDAAWVLPANARTQEQFQWLAAEIKELGGDVQVWNSELADSEQSTSLVRQFSVQVDAELDLILKAITKKRPDLKRLAQRYREATSRDYFQSPLGQKVREALLSVQRGRS